MRRFRSDRVMEKELQHLFLYLPLCIRKNIHKYGMSIYTHICIRIYIHMYGMSIYIYTYTYVYICYIHICVHIYIGIYIYVHACTSMSRSVFVSMYIWTYVCIHLCLDLDLYLCVYIYTYMYMHVHLCLDLCLHVYIYTYVFVCLCVSHLQVEASFRLQTFCRCAGIEVSQAGLQRPSATIHAQALEHQCLSVPVQELYSRHHRSCRPLQPRKLTSQQTVMYSRDNQV